MTWPYLERDKARKGLAILNTLTQAFRALPQAKATQMKLL